MYTIANLIYNTQKRHGESTLELIERFMPLLKKYALLLCYEDAFEDLQTDFLTSVYNINFSTVVNLEDCVLIKYIQKIIYHAYSKRLKNYIFFQKGVIPFCSISPSQKLSMEYDNAFYDSYFKLTFDDVKSILTFEEYSVIARYLLFGQSISSIADSCKVSRQTTNRIKLSALNKLKQKWA